MRMVSWILEKVSNYVEDGYQQWLVNKGLVTLQTLGLLIGPTYSRAGQDTTILGNTVGF